MPSSTPTYQKGNQLKICKVLWNASDYTKILLLITQKTKNSYLPISQKKKQHKNINKTKCYHLASPHKDYIDDLRKQAQLQLCQNNSQYRPHSMLSYTVTLC